MNLLSLPVEIRACILEQFLSTGLGYDWHIRVWRNTSALDDRLDFNATNFSPCNSFHSLLLCNKTISYETSSILFGKTTFSFGSWDTMVLWLKSIGPQNRGLLANLQLSETSWLLNPDRYSFLPVSHRPRPLEPMSIEGLFKLLVHTGQEARNLALVVHLDTRLAPKQSCFNYSFCRGGMLFSMKTLDVMEKSRGISSGTRAIDIFYKGKAIRRYLEPEGHQDESHVKPGSLRAMGWQLLIHGVTDMDFDMTDYTLRFRQEILLHQQKTKSAVV